MTVSLGSVLIQVLGVCAPVRGVGRGYEGSDDYPGTGLYYDVCRCGIPGSHYLAYVLHYKNA